MSVLVEDVGYGRQQRTQTCQYRQCPMHAHVLVEWYAHHCHATSTYIPHQRRKGEARGRQ